MFATAFAVVVLLTKLLADSRELSWRSHLRYVMIDAITASLAFVAIRHFLG